MLPHALLSHDQFAVASYKLLHSILHCIADDKDMSVKAVIAAYTLRPTQPSRQTGLAPANNKRQETGWVPHYP